MALCVRSALLILFALWADTCGGDVATESDSLQCSATSSGKCSSCHGVACVEAAYNDTQDLGHRRVGGSDLIVEKLGRAGVYGEITAEGVQSIVASLGLTNSTHAFADVGSGVGKVVMQVAVTTRMRAKGIEFSESRHREAVASLGRLRSLVADDVWRDVGSRIELIQDDARTVDLHDTNVIFMNSLCFPTAVLKDIAGHISTSAPEGTLAMSVLPIPGCARRFFLLGYMNVSMSWNPEVPLYVYMTTGAPKHVVEHLLSLRNIEGPSIPHGLREVSPLGTASWQEYSTATWGIATSSAECDTFDRAAAAAEEAASKRKPQCNAHCRSKSQCIMSVCNGCDFCDSEL